MASSTEGREFPNSQGREFLPRRFSTEIRRPGRDPRIYTILGRPKGHAPTFFRHSIEQLGMLFRLLVSHAEAVCRSAARGRSRLEPSGHPQPLRVHTYGPTDPSSAVAPLTKTWFLSWQTSARDATGEVRRRIHSRNPPDNNWARSHRGFAERVICQDPSGPQAGTAQDPSGPQSTREHRHRGGRWGGASK